jgi:hypothetical protein
MASAGDFETFLRRLASAGVAQRSDLRGCSHAEIAALEARYAVRLPDTYRRYLELMGHSSGRLFTHDHMAVFYRYVLEITGEMRHVRLTQHSNPDDPPPPGFAIPDDAIFIAARLGASWEFIRCTSDADSPVWQFDEGRWTIVQSHASVLDWLNAWCTAAEDAIADGYFDQNPKGAAP